MSVATTRADRLERSVLDVLERTGRPMTGGEISFHVRSMPAVPRDLALATLIESGRVELIERRNRGRGPVRVYRLYRLAGGGEP